MVQTVIVVAVVAGTVVLAARWAVRTMKGHGGCGCGCKDCPQAKKGCHQAENSCKAKK